jgi:hypothetical protein
LTQLLEVVRYIWMTEKVEESWRKMCVWFFLRCAGEAGERLPLGKSEQFCAYLLFVGALAARLSDG